MKSLLLTLSLPLVFFGNTTISSNVCEPITTPSITNPSNGQQLTTRQVPVSGSASGNTTIVIRLDGQNKLSLTADNSGSFEGTLSIPSGSHQLVAVSSSGCESLESTPVAVNGYVDPQPPENPPANPPASNNPGSNNGGSSSVSSNAGTSGSNSGSSGSSPANNEENTGTKPTARYWARFQGYSNGDSTTEDSVIVYGEISGSGTIKIYRGGTLLAETYDLSESFSLRIPLTSGDNVLKIVATINGEEVEQTLEITKTSKTDNNGSQNNNATNGRKGGIAGWIESLGVWFYAAAGAAITIIAGSTWWFLIGKKKMRDDDDPQTPIGGGPWV